MSSSESSRNLQRESGLGPLDFQAAAQAASTPRKTNRKSYQKWSNEDRFNIGKYAAIHGPAAATRKFSSRSQPLNESTVRGWCKLYQDEVKKASKEKRSVGRELAVLRRGRPLLLGTLDQMVQKFLLAVRNRGGIITSAIAVSVAKALIARNPQLNLAHIDLDSSSWAKSLFQRMGFVKRMKTTGKVEIPEGAKKEAQLLYLHDIVSLVEEHNIPDSLVMNLDQTPLKYVPSGNHTLAKKGTKSIGIAGSSDKRCITATFVVTLDGSFLPIQLIYGGKTTQSLPRFKFPDSFSLSVNPKHFSNTAESIKVIDEVILPYVKAQREALGKPDQAALLVFDVFRGQITDEVTSHLTRNNIFFIMVPNNMTHLFQPLDLTVNGHCKKFMKSKFSDWYTQQVQNALDAGVKVENINIEFKLTTMKPLHASWIVDYYNHIASVAGVDVIVKGWKIAGIYDAIKKGKLNLPSVDPFNEIAPLAMSPDEIANQPSFIEVSDEIREGYVNEIVENDEDDDDNDDDAEWGFEEDFDRNAFDFIIDDECNEYNSVERYDPTRDEWLSVASMSSKREGLVLVSHDHVLYALGGENGVSILNTVERYDPRTGIWYNCASMGYRRRYFGAVELDNKIYSIGGSDYEEDLNTVELFEARSNRWIPIPSMNRRRESVAVVATEDKIFAMGGACVNKETDTVECYDPQLNKWESFCVIPRAKEGMGAVAL